MNYHDGNRGNESHDPLDKWIHELKPPEPKFSRDSDKFIEGFHKKMLEEKRGRAERRKKNLQRGSVVMIVALVFVGFFSFNEVGSDGFEMVVVENASTPGGVVKNEFRGDGFNLFEGESDKQIQSLNRSITAREGVITKVEGWTIKNKTHWSVICEVGRDGQKETFSRSPRSIPSNTSKDHAQFFSQEWSDFSTSIQVGQLPPNFFENREIDGLIFQLSVWKLETKVFGEVVYYQGSPTR